MKNLKFLFIAILLISSSLNSYSQSVEEIMNTVVAELNKNCPQEVGDDVYMTSVEYKDKVFTVNIKLDLVDEDDFSEDADDFKDAFCLGLLQNENGQFLTNLMEEGKIKICVSFTLADGSVKKLYLTGKDLDKYISDDEW